MKKESQIIVLHFNLIKAFPTSKQFQSLIITAMWKYHHQHLLKLLSSSTSTVCCCRMKRTVIWSTSGSCFPFWRVLVTFPCLPPSSSLSPSLSRDGRLSASPSHTRQVINSTTLMHLLWMLWKLFFFRKLYFHFSLCFILRQMYCTVLQMPLNLW